MPKLTAASMSGCAFKAQLLGPDPAGSATSMQSWLLIEQPGAWTIDALDKVLAEAFGVDGGELPEGMRPLLIRRPGRYSPEQENAPRSIFIGSGVPGDRWLVRLEIRSLRELADLDFAEILSNSGGIGEPVADPLFLVCTHGTRDVCCAVLGRPLAMALNAEYPEVTWETSHVGGDRWAGNLLVVPDGFLHGHVGPDEGILVAKSALAGEVELKWLRGRTSEFSRWSQYAEIAVRKHVGLRGIDEVMAVSEVQLNDPEIREVRVRGNQKEFSVTVRQSPAAMQTVSRCTERISITQFETKQINQIPEGP